MEAVTNVEYAVINRGDKCPFCGSYEHYPAGEFHEDSAQVWRKAECVDCGKGWNAIYYLVGFSEVCPT